MPAVYLTDTQKEHIQQHIMVSPVPHPCGHVEGLSDFVKALASEQQARIHPKPH